MSELVFGLVDSYCSNSGYFVPNSHYESSGPKTSAQSGVSVNNKVKQVMKNHLPRNPFSFYLPINGIQLGA